MNMLSFLSGLLFIVGFVPYSVEVLQKKAVPAKATWIIWIVLDLITLAGMIAKHAVNFQIIGCVTGGFIVMLLAIKYGAPGWTKLDKFCLLGAILGLVLWGLSRNPVVGMCTSLSVVFLGSFPTFVSAWEDYRRESKVGWTIFFASCCLAVMAIPKWDLPTMAQPVTFFVIETIMMVILYARPAFLKTKFA